MILFRILGPVDVAHQPDGSVLSRFITVRALLATLLYHRGQYVPVHRLAESVWPEPPASAQANLRTHITALRRALDECVRGLGSRLTTRRGVRGTGAAYRLAATPDQVDADVFVELADRGHDLLATGNVDAAAADLHSGLRLWRGPAGDDLPETPALLDHANELAERRFVASDDLAEARLQPGDSTGLITDLRRSLSANPHRERTAELLVRALYADGDRPAAITTYEHLRHRLADDLGVQPSARLQRLHLALLRDDPTSLGVTDEPPTVRGPAGAGWVAR
jgi:DNA-binding SARP family transcriptional activator